MTEGREGSPLGLPRASQKITAAALLIRAMLEPSTPEGCNLRKEAQARRSAAGREFRVSDALGALGESWRNGTPGP